MLKAIQAVQRSYLRAPMRQFVLSQRQFISKPAVNQQGVAMSHDIKKEVK
jgi:hypothetical protein